MKVGNGLLVRKKQLFDSISTLGPRDTRYESTDIWGNFNYEQN